MRSFRIAAILLLAAQAALAGYLPLLKAGGSVSGGGGIVQGNLIQLAGAGLILQLDGTSKIQWTQ
jgi:hypothetical protein